MALASIRRIPFYSRTNFQFKDVDKMGLPPYLAVHPLSVPTDCSLITGGIGDVQPGDSVYEISEQRSRILRQGSLVAFGIGFGSMDPTYFVQTSFTNDYLVNQLFIDYSNLWGCRVLFEEGSKLPEHI